MIYLVDPYGGLACTYNDEMAHQLETTGGYKRVSREEYEKMLDRCSSGSAIERKKEAGNGHGHSPVRG